jgi:hypothetical protein
MGRTSELGYGGMVLAASSESVGLLFRMLQDANRAQILARPTLTTIDNNVSVINVGQSIPVLAGTSNSIGVVQQNVTYVNAGLTLQIQPRTNEDGLINMIVAISRSTVDRANGLEVSNGAAGVAGTTLTPAFNQTVAQTRVTAYDGQTVVIGGLISKSRESTSRRVPWLADIPVAGALFRFDKEIENRTELLVVMTPRVINANDANKMDMIKMVESSRMSWCLADVLNMYGDKGLSAGNGLWGPAASPLIYPDETPTVEFESNESTSPTILMPSNSQPTLEPSYQEMVQPELYLGDPNTLVPQSQTIQPQTIQPQIIQPQMVQPQYVPNNASSTRNPQGSLIQGGVNNVSPTTR